MLIALALQRALPCSGRAKLAINVRNGEIDRRVCGNERFRALAVRNWP